VINDNTPINPFQQLYISDSTRTADSFVSLFSDKVLQSAISPVFQEGNVVLLGTQGCGKTMILNLLRPEIRIAYAKAGVPFPVDSSICNFISAGVNLSQSQIPHVAQMTMGRALDEDFKELPLLFGDYFNYCIAHELIKSIRLIGGQPEVFNSIVDVSNIDEFAAQLSHQDCWMGALNGVRTFVELESCIQDRKSCFQNWVNGNLFENKLPETIAKTKTSIGVPIVRFGTCLKECGIISEEVPILVRVDQLEEITRAQTERQGRLFKDFRKMLNCPLADREGIIHYRIGSRPYGWNKPDHLIIWGNEAQLEHRRDYLLVDMDQELFNVAEQGKKSIFPEFARDAFKKRVAYFHVEKLSNLPSNMCLTVFGKSPTPKKRIGALKEKRTDKQVKRALGLNLASESNAWTKEWEDFLLRIFRFDGHAGMLNATLAAAWGRQTGGGQSKIAHRESPPPEEMAPWCDKKWWRKERIGQAVLQLMVRCQQRYVWWGEGDIYALSDGSITVFLHICHRIWDAFLKQQACLSDKEHIHILQGEAIPVLTQATAIQHASNEWYRKMPEEPQGNSRQRFIDYLGEYLNRHMVGDLKMSYPGANGISLPLSQYNGNNEDAKRVRDFLEDAVGYGVLRKREHASKSKASGRRVKFYLNNILCPRYQLPEGRTKEPMYMNLEDVSDILFKAKVLPTRIRRCKKDVPEKLPLFPEM